MLRKIKEILMERDGMSELEAQELIDDTRAEIFEAIENGDLSAPDDIIACNLGLEPDYLDELIF